ncbi:UNVERIFIED_CONTAM: hypothetical protein NCL1_52015 [Trichonephila clavipes]
MDDILNYIVKNCGAKLPPRPNEFYPSKKYYSYLNVNIPGLKAKLLEFTNIAQKSQHVPPAEIEKVALLASFPDEVTEEQMQILDTIITWNDEYACKQHTKYINKFILDSFLANWENSTFT